MRGLVEVAIPVPVDRTFTYRVPEGREAEAVPGRRVIVPFGRKERTRGFIVGPGEEAEGVELKEVSELLDDGPVLMPDVLELSRFISRYYGCSLGEALDATLPSGVKHGRSGRRVPCVELIVPVEEARVAAEALPVHREKQARVLRHVADAGGSLPLADLTRAAAVTRSPVDSLAKAGLLRVVRLEIRDDPFGGPTPPGKEPPVLTGEQEIAVRAIGESVAAEDFAAFLLFGITGSGKTEVYLRAIGEGLERGRKAIVLVPEISLTPQTVRRFRARFERVAVLHSALSEAERRRAWRACRDGEVDVVIGPRSAIFAPLPRLGLVIVDEEHDTSFKQGRAPRYHGRDVAVVRARIAKAAVILGSATPALESWQNARIGKYRMLTLTERVGGGALPPVEIVDMSREMAEVKRFTWLSRRLRSLIAGSIASGDQGMLFLNRRGFSTLLLCKRCGEDLSCQDCSVTLTYHQGHDRAACHLCGFTMRVPEDCPACGQPGLLYRGFGTEKIEEEISAEFPDARVGRMDSDTTSRRGSHEEILARVESGELDILVGTQMIAKGLHFPRVTAVGVVDADTALRIPDFRASERTFQLIAQVAGRTGRTERGGRVVVQTFRKDQPALAAAAAHDYRRFAEEELELRRLLGYPPFGRILLVVVQGKRAPTVNAKARDIAALLAARPDVGRILGPAIPPLDRLKGKVRRQVIVKAPGARELARAVDRLRGKSFRGAEVILDVDPVSMM